MTLILQLTTALVVACWSGFLGWKSSRHFLRAASRAYRTGKVTNSVSDLVDKRDAPTIYWPTLFGLILLAMICVALSVGVAYSALCFAYTLLGSLF